MTDLDRQVSRCRRRLWLDRWLGQLGWCLTVAAGLWGLGVLLTQRLIVLRVEWPMTLSAAVLGGAAVMASLVWLALTRQSAAHAAAYLDEAGGLKERVSTGLYCRGSSDPFAQAAYVDAQKIASRLDARRLTPIRMPYSARYTGLAAVAAGLCLLVPRTDVLGLLEREQQQRERQNRARQTAHVVAKTIADVKEAAQRIDPDFKDLADLSNLEPPVVDQNPDPSAIRRKAIKKLERVGSALKGKRDLPKYTQLEDIPKIMKQMGLPSDDPGKVNQVHRQLFEGDLKAASETLKELAEELASRKPKTPEDKKKAERIKQQLEDLARRLKKASDQELTDAAKKSGLTGEQLQRMLDSLSKKDFDAMKKQLAQSGMKKDQIDPFVQQLKKKQQACSTCKKLGDQMGQAAGQMGTGAGNAQAGESLGEAAQTLSDLEGLEQELNQLDSTLSQLENAKNQLGQQGDGQCPNCGGEGCGQCDGTGQQGGTGQGGMGLKPGQGRGGLAEKQEAPHGVVKDRQKTEFQPGAIIMRKFVDDRGNQIRGEARAEYTDAAISAVREATDALADDDIPRTYHKSVKEYFDGLKDAPAGDSAPKKPGN